ncbi:ribosomal maturation YjgA family protein [Chitinilyticum litopenaei]|uniref:ribosomal maturation YjgA family protein n=1 Tax=Chitinilyticum litopenaei TaxID=1121276 RepID=UPI0004270647|nr:DUF2809 domain-containing protein [Chitinilyticum litopenaei]
MARYYPKLHFSPRHALLAAALLGTEIAIGSLFDDRFIRPYLGDVLVIPLLYCLIRSAWQGAQSSLPWLLLALGLLVEGAQWLRLADLLARPDPSLLRTVIGTHADPLDVLAYLAGTLAIVALRRTRR